jgi:hypothetical protein
MADIAFTKSPQVAQQAGAKAVDDWESEIIALGASANNKGDITVLGYHEFEIEFDHDISGSSSTSIKLEVFASLKGAVFGTVALTTISFTSTGVAHADFSGPFAALRLKVTNGDAGNTDNSVVRVTARR